MSEITETKGFLYIVGTRVFVTGTKHHGFYGVVTATPHGWSARSMAVILGEWPNQIFKFYRHNLIPEWEFK